MQDEHLLAPTHAILPDDVLEWPATAAPGTGRLIGVPVGICAATPLGSQDSNQNLAVHTT